MSALVDEASEQREQCERLRAQLNTVQIEFDETKEKLEMAMQSHANAMKTMHEARKRELRQTRLKNRNVEKIRELREELDEKQMCLDAVRNARDYAENLVIRQRRYILRLEAETRRQRQAHNGSACSCKPSSDGM